MSGKIGVLEVDWLYGVFCVCLLLVIIEFVGEVVVGFMFVGFFCLV